MIEVKRKREIVFRVPLGLHQRITTVVLDCKEAKRWEQSGLRIPVEGMGLLLLYTGWSGGGE